MKIASTQKLVIKVRNILYTCLQHKYIGLGGPTDKNRKGLGRMNVQVMDLSHVCECNVYMDFCFYFYSYRASNLPQKFVKVFLNTEYNMLCGIFLLFSGFLGT